MATYTELLNLIDTAIKDILENGQHISRKGRIYIRGDLEVLMDIREKYAKLAAMETSSSGNLLERTTTIIPHRER